MNKKPFSVYLSDMQRKKLKKEAEETGLSVSSVVKTIINKHFQVGKKYDN